MIVPSSSRSSSVAHCRWRHCCPSKHLLITYQLTWLYILEDLRNLSSTTVRNSNLTLC